MGLTSLIDAMKRYAGLVVHPEDEWNIVVAEKPGVVDVLYPFTVIGIVASLLAAIAGALLRTGEHSILLDMVSKPIVTAGGVAAFAAVTGLVVRKVDAVRPAMGEVAALYSSAGMWMASILEFVPVPVLGWVWLLIGAAYSGYLLYMALDMVCGVPGHSRLTAFLLSMGGLLIVSSALRMAMLMLEG